MIKREIVNQKTGEKLIMFKDTDFEYKKPVKHYKDSFIVKQMVMSGISEDELNGITEPNEKRKQIFIKIADKWDEMLAKFKQVELPNELIKLFNTKKKKVQVDLLKRVILNPDILMAFLIKAEDLGYTLSQYTSEHLQKGLDLSKLPFAYEVKDDGSIKTFGNTELSDGQLKQAIEHRKVKIAKFLDKKDEWHCFFTTYKSLRGEETWLGEKQPHYHYLSSAFGIDRAQVVNQIKLKKYNLGNLPHIKLEDYGKQPKNKK